jgi:hypothetical protein
MPLMAEHLMNDIEKLRAVVPSGQSLRESGDLLGTRFTKMTGLYGVNKPGNACFRSATYCLSSAERVTDYALTELRRLKDSLL